MALIWFGLFKLHYVATVASPNYFICGVSILCAGWHMAIPYHSLSNCGNCMVCHRRLSTNLNVGLHVTMSIVLPLHGNSYSKNCVNNSSYGINDNIIGRLTNAVL